MGRIRVPRKGVTQAELAAVLSRRLGGGYQVEPDGDGRVVVRRSPLATAVVRIRDVQGATVFRCTAAACRCTGSARPAG